MKKGYLFLAGYVATIILANFFIAHVGTTCIPNGPCLVPVWWGVMAPSGVIWAGLAFSLRDAVQHELGPRWTVVAVLFGAALSALISSPALALASGAAFLISELLDFAVYTPLRARGLYLAVLASNVVGLVVDSFAFLLLAFGSLATLEGQIWGKFEVTLLTLLVMRLWQQRGKSSVVVSLRGN